MISNLAARIMLDEKNKAIDPIDIFRPTEVQEPFFEKMSEDEILEVLLGGGNRCLHGSQTVYDPVEKTYRRVDEIDGDFHVYGRDPSSGERIACVANKPFIKGSEPFFEVTFSDGGTITVTASHRFLTVNGSWRSLDDVGEDLLASTSGPFVSGFRRDDGLPLLGWVSAKAVKIVSAIPVPKSDVWDFEVKATSNYECGGVLNHNSGKTVSAAVAFAAMVRNKDITFHDGRKISMRPERWRHEAMKIWVIGQNWGRISSTLYRVLFKPDLFRIVRDKETGLWRSWNPMLPGECERKLTRPSPPLINKDSDVAPGTLMFESKLANEVKSFEMMNDGTRVEFYASSGAMPMGDPAHFIWVDEKLDDENWVPELMVRLIDHRGRLLWTTYPGTSPSIALSEAADRASRQAGDPAAKSFYFILPGDKNPFNQSTHREAIMATMSEEERAARDQGVLSQERWLIYPNFNQYIHRVLPSDPAADDKLAAAVRHKGGIPEDWTRYLILDPGTQHPAVLLVAVPPPRLGDFVVPYDEIYAGRLNAKQIAEAVLAKTKGQYFEDFIIDSRAARQTPMGFDGKIGENYEVEFEKCKLRCRKRGSRFSYGSDNVAGRQLRLNGAMNIRGDGTVRLRIHGCPSLVRQLQKYKWEADPQGNPSENPSKRQQVDVCQALEYYISRDDVGYVRPQEMKPKVNTPSSIASNIAMMLGIQKKPEKDSVSIGPP